jgi:hypothetical protein
VRDHRPPETGRSRHQADPGRGTGGGGRQWAHLLWVLAAGGLGMTVSMLGASVLHLSRHWFLVLYVLIIGVFLAGYVQWSGLHLSAAIRERWGWGLVGALVVGAVLVWSVLRQPASPRPQGLAWVTALVWLGVIYGALDGVFLTVMPVMAIRQALVPVGAGHTWWRGLGRATGALAASLFVTAAYHWGYAEFRGPEIAGPLLGNALITVGYLLATNPLTPVLAHIAMHVAAVLHGIETTVQLPPHD